MKFIRSIIIACAFMPVAASAADLPAKAPTRFVAAYPYDGSGIYCGLGTFGETQKIGLTSPVAGTTTGTFASGGSLTAGCGYTKTFGPTRWVSIEGSFAYANTGANQAGVDVSTKFSGTQRIMYGGDMSMLTQWLPNLSTILPVLPPLPAAATCPPGQTCNPLAHPYVAGVLREARNEVTIGGQTDKKFRVTYGLGAGILTQLTDGSVVDTWTDATSSSGAHLTIVGGMTERTGITYRAGMTYKFGLSRN